MPSVPHRLRAVLVGVVATATIATGLTAGLVTPAHASMSAALQIESVYPEDRSGAAGTCHIFRARPLNARGEQPTSDTSTVRIRLKEMPSSDAQDVDFCTPEQPAPDGEGASAPKPGTATYNESVANYSPPGRSVATAVGEFGSSGTPGPDIPSSTPTSSRGEAGRNNYNGVDQSTVTFVGGQFVEFGLSALVPGSVVIEAVIDPADRAIAATPVTFTITDGGKPQSTQAYNAASEITTDREQYAAVKSDTATAQILATVLNKSGDTLYDVTPSYRVESGPNASSTIRACTATTNYGLSTCSYEGAMTGTDTLLIWVNKSAPTNGVATAGPDPGEPTRTVTVTTYQTSSLPQNARFIDLTPDSPTSQTAGTSKVFTATVTDSAGVPVEGVTVTFEETGPGQIVGGSSTDGVFSTRTAPTAPDGRAQVTTAARVTESGAQTVTARISNSSTACATLINGQAGRCADSTTNTVTAPSPAPSPTATATGSPRPTSSASPSSTPSATPSSTTSPGQCTTTPTVTLSPSTINATGSAGVTINAPAGRRVQLFAYSQPSTTYRAVREGTTSSNGTISFTVRPPTNTRLYAQIVGCDTDDVRFSKVLNVRTTLSLFVTRNGKQDYTFSGDSLPARPGGLIVSLYRVTNDGRQILTAQARARTDNGDWVIRRVFTGTGRFDFIVRTGQDLQNAPGQSNVRSLLIF